MYILLLCLMGTPTLTHAGPCLSVAQLDCYYNCLTDNVVISWVNADNYVFFEVERDGVVIASGLPGSTTSFLHPTPTPGVGTYRIVASCANGWQSEATCTVEVPTPASELILALEGGQSAGLLGAIDSGSALRDALVAVGRNVTVLRQDFLNYPCLASLIASAENIWLTTGTWPNDYRLSAAEGDALAIYAQSGKNIYLEGGDHWAFSHIASNFDAHDGVEDGTALDGIDEFSTMFGLNAPAFAIDLGVFGNVPYLEDRPGQNDYNDQLLPSGSTIGVTPDPVSAANVLWRNYDDAGGTEGDFATTIAAIDPFGAVVISSSWEFGGFGGNQVQLVTRYLQAFGVITDVPFVRGNCTGHFDGSVTLADAVYLIGYLFPQDLDGDGFLDQNTLVCSDACDANNDGGLNILDVVVLLQSVFGNPVNELPAPNLATGCGFDPVDAGDPLSCDLPHICP
ncbi:MAG: hypothetical protein AAF581_07045 [Planctomycetota bacterium]